MRISNFVRGQWRSAPLGVCGAEVCSLCSCPVGPRPEASECSPVLKQLPPLYSSRLCGGRRRCSVCGGVGAVTCGLATLREYRAMSSRLRSTLSQSSSHTWRRYSDSRDVIRCRMAWFCRLTSSSSSLLFLLFRLEGRAREGRCCHSPTLFSPKPSPFKPNSPKPSPFKPK